MDTSESILKTEYHSKSPTERFGYESINQSKLELVNYKKQFELLNWTMHKNVNENCWHFWTRISFSFFLEFMAHWWSPSPIVCARILSKLLNTGAKVFLLFVEKCEQFIRTLWQRPKAQTTGNQKFTCRIMSKRAFLGAVSAVSAADDADLLYLIHVTLAIL